MRVTGAGQSGLLNLQQLAITIFQTAKNGHQMRFLPIGT
jgi:hypothetical protein